MTDDDVAQQVDEHAKNSTGLAAAVRIGLVAYGIVHLLIAWVAVRLTVEHGSGTATGAGALAQLAGDRSGRVVLIAIACAFVALAVWQLIAAAVGFRDLSGRSRHLNRIGAASRVAVYAYFAWVSGKQAFQRSSGSGRSPESMTSKVLAAPAGQAVLTAVGLGAVAIGLGLAIFGARKGFLPQLDRTARTQDRRVPIVVLGQVGYVVKGLSFAVIGGLLVWAAFTQDPGKSGGLDHELYLLLGHTMGKLAVVVVGAGFACFALFLFARARHLAPDSITS